MATKDLFRNFVTVDEICADHYIPKTEKTLQIIYTQGGSPTKEGKKTISSTGRILATKDFLYRFETVDKTYDHYYTAEGWKHQGFSVTEESKNYFSSRKVYGTERHVRSFVTADKGWGHHYPPEAREHSKG